jgi:hypothetical protein
MPAAIKERVRNNFPTSLFFVLMMMMIGGGPSANQVFSQG